MTIWRHSHKLPTQDTLSAGANLASHVIDAEGTQHVFFNANDNKIYEIWWRPGEPERAIALSGEIRVDLLLASLVAADGTQHVFYEGNNRTIREL
jgi:hypothetical protein